MSIHLRNRKSSQRSGEKRLTEKLRQSGFAGPKITSM